MAALLAGDPTTLPSPARVVAALGGVIASGALPWDFAVTFARVLAAFVIAMLAGGALGYAAGRSARLDALLDPWIVVALNLPLLVVVVLCYLWVGLTEAAAILAVVVAKVPSIAVTVREGARALDRGYDDLGTVFAVSGTSRARLIVLPQLSPYLVAAGRAGLSITWKIVLVVELLGRPDGVGFALNTYFQAFDVTGVLAYGLSFSAVMLAVEGGLLRPLERRVNGWR